MSGRHRIQTRFIVASMLVGLGLIAPAVARAATTVDLDQWASTDVAWQNGNLNGNNSRYPEGGIVPFRVAFEGLKAGSHEIHINYDFTAGGHKAYDFLATWNVTNASGKSCSKSGGAISSMCPSLPASSSAAFPSDPFIANGLSVAGAEKYSGAPRRLTIWGGTITSISRPVHSGSVNGNSTADILVRFRSTGSAVLLSWGGHLAQSRYWDTAGGGARDGASLVSGAPWHMRTLRLDGAGNKNQDRSIQPSAIVGELPPQALAPTPRPTPRPPVVSAPTPRPPSNPGRANAPHDPNPAAHDPGPLGTVPPTSTAAVRPGTENGALAFLYVLLLTTGIVGGSLHAARRVRSRSRAQD
jgi:hypothetical protein